MPTLWNTPVQVPAFYDVFNTMFRALGTSRNGKLLTDFDIQGEPLDEPGRVVGLAEYCGVQEATMRTWLAPEGARYRRILILREVSVPVVKNKIVIGYNKQYALAGRRLYDMKDSDGAGPFDPALIPLRARVFTAALLGGDIQRIPIFHGKEYTSTETFPGIVSAIDYLLENAFIAKNDKYIRFAWYKLYVLPVYVDGDLAWQAVIKHRAKLNTDTYEEITTDLSGKPDGKVVFDPLAY